MTRLPGVGQKRKEQLAGVEIQTISDLLYYFPRRYLDRSQITPIAKVNPNTETTVIGRIESCGIKRGRKTRFIIYLFDGTGYIQCVWFNQVQLWERIFKAGETIAFHGKVAYYGGLQMVHPDFDKLSDEESLPDQVLNTSAIIALYPSSEALGRVGLDSRGFRRLMKEALKSYGDLIPESLTPSIIGQYQLVPLTTALHQIHFPTSAESLAQAQQRLKFNELFFLELMLAFRKRYMALRTRGIEFKVVGEKTRNLVENLPFQLTEAQKRVLREIRADMKRENPMYRLVQGDVGSGKTIVALISMLIAVENGYQAALMAPTEILAEQHYFTISQLLEGLQVKTALVVGAQNAQERQQLTAGLRSGEIDIIVGTHALIQAGIEFHKLGLVIIDEQHRFGVVQRVMLREKGFNPDVIVMTATPIPRTLSLTLFGDLDVSIIDELPAGRMAIKTVWRYEEKRAEIYQFVKTQVQAGHQAYIVFPLVEESEKSDLRAATESYEKLCAETFRDLKVALLHGRLKSAEKESIMRRFKAGDLQILVTTTVIEVGVDVPQATIMVIEHAERFGLTQLHQLRGRVGRGAEQSFCILIAVPPLTAEAQKRLNTMIRTNDGFQIAEVDLEIRGPGEFFGTRQHGLPELRLANLLEDKQLLLDARKAAFELIARDPQLLSDEARAVREHFIENYRSKFDLVKIG